MFSVPVLTEKPTNTNGSSNVAGTKSANDNTAVHIVLNALNKKGDSLFGSTDDVFGIPSKMVRHDEEKQMFTFNFEEINDPSVDNDEAKAAKPVEKGTMTSSNTIEFRNSSF